MRARSVLLFFLFCLIFVDARKNNIDISSEGQRIRLVEGFGCSEGAWLSVSLSVSLPMYTSYSSFESSVDISSLGVIANDDDDDDNNSGTSEEVWVYFVIFTESQYQDALSYSSTDTCTVPSFYREEFRDQLDIELTMDGEEYFYLYLINCFKEPINITGTIEWRQSDGGHLSYDLVPMLFFYPFFLFLFSISNIIWIVMIISKGRRNIVAYHILLEVVIFLEACYYALETSSISIQNFTGIPDAILPNVIPVSVNVMAEMYFIWILLLLCTGWKIVTRRLRLRSKQLLITAIILYSGFDLAYQLCPETQHIHDVFELFYHVIKFFILFAAIIALNSAVEQIREQFRITHPQRNQLTDRCVLFSDLRIVFLLLLVIPILLAFIEFTVLQWQEAWLPPTVNGCLLFVCFWAVAYSIRPTSERNIYIQNHQPIPTEEQVIINENENHDEEEEEEDNDDDGNNEIEEGEGHEMFHPANPGDIEMQIFSSNSSDDEDEDEEW